MILAHLGVSEIYLEKLEIDDFNLAFYMFELININKSKPYALFSKHLDNALLKKQDAIDAISISSFDRNKNIVDSRYVNLKYIIEDKWVFFSNYKSEKASQFLSHNQIAASFFWPSTNIQIRMRAIIDKIDAEFSDMHFQKRQKKKNALAVSSFQSSRIASYKLVQENYIKTLSDEGLIQERPSYWGGYSFVPFYFEFWEGHESRINKREVFNKINSSWKQLYLQP